MPSDCEERCRHVIGGDGLVLGAFGFGVGFADHLAALDSAAAEEAEHAAGIVVAAGVLVDLGRAAEFAGDEDRGRSEQALGFQRAEQAGEASVEVGEDFVLEGIEVLRVGVPAAELRR